MSWCLAICIASSQVPGSLTRESVAIAGFRPLAFRSRRSSSIILESDLYRSGHSCIYFVTVWSRWSLRWRRTGCWGTSIHLVIPSDWNLATVYQFTITKTSRLSIIYGGTKHHPLSYQYNASGMASIGHFLDTPALLSTLLVTQNKPVLVLPPTLQQDKDQLLSTSRWHVWPIVSIVRRRRKEPTRHSQRWSCWFMPSNTYHSSLVSAEFVSTHRASSRSSTSSQLVQSQGEPSQSLLTINIIHVHSLTSCSHCPGLERHLSLSHSRPPHRATLVSFFVSAPYSRRTISPVWYLNHYMLRRVGILCPKDDLSLQICNWSAVLLPPSLRAYLPHLWPGGRDPTAPMGTWISRYGEGVAVILHHSSSLTRVTSARSGRLCWPRSF